MSNLLQTDSRPDVSVIIPVYNDAVRLDTCLRELENQTYPTAKYEVVVVDNASTEDISRVCSRHAHVRYLHEARPGSYAARNKGVAYTHAPMLAFTDSDCIPSANWIERGVDRLTSMPDCGLVGGKIEVFFEDPSRPTLIELYESVVAFPQRHYVESNHWAATANLFTRRDVIATVGLFDDTMRSGGDADWGRQVHETGYRLAYAGDAVVKHPARASFAELRGKEIRVAGGLYKMILENDDSVRYFAYYLTRMSYYTLRKSVSLLFGSTFMKRKIDRLSALERLKVASVLNYVHLTRLVEIVSLRLDSGRELRR